VIVLDQLSRPIEIVDPCHRIISLVPSITELLADLGLTNRIIGVTKFCVHPPDLRHSKANIGGTKQIRIQDIRALQPDLIIANKEENVQDQVELVATFCPTYVSDINCIADVLSLLRDIGQMCHCLAEASKLESLLRDHAPRVIFNGQRVLYLIWRDPYMTVGGETYISYILEELGLHNVCREQRRYPKLSLEQIKKMDIDYIFLSSEPYPFSEKHRLYLAEQLPDVRSVLVDGEAFSWYGSRLTHLPRYFSFLKKKLVIHS